MKFKVFWVVCMFLVGCRPANVEPTAAPVSVAFAPTAIPTQTVATSAPPPASTQFPGSNLQSPTPLPISISNPQSPISISLNFTQLTTGGCCVQPFFLADGVRVAFMDRPSAEAPTGMYVIPINAPLAQPTLLTERLGPFSRDMSYSADLLSAQTFVERASDGTKFPINNGGRSISFAPDSSQIAWTVGQDAGNFDVRRNEIWLANIDGSNARRVATRYGGGIVAWFNHSPRIIISGKANRTDAAPTLAILNLTEEDIQPLFTAERIRGFTLAPDDRHLVYFIAQAQDESLNGLYLLALDALDTSNPQPQKLNFFGAYKWRDANRLLYIPLKLNAPSHELWQLNVTTGQSELLIPANPDSPFRVANGDWDVADDGKHLAFVNAKDKNIWLTPLP